MQLPSDGSIVAVQVGILVRFFMAVGFVFIVVVPAARPSDFVSADSWVDVAKTRFFGDRTIVAIVGFQLVVVAGLTVKPLSSTSEC